jgi:osmoprotectant transport system permease protein
MRSLVTLLLIFTALSLNAQKIRVGAKHFNEGYILSEIISQLLESRDFEVERMYNLGGTMVCFEALRTRQIDVYPEYTGSLASEILKSDEKLTFEQIRQKLLAKLKMTISDPYGFSNTYAFVIRKDLSHASGIKKISDLRAHPGLRIGVSYEFLKRNDGWENLSRRYRLPHKPLALEHGLAYDALTENKIDVTDAYSTDGEIRWYDLTLLEDDLDFFPEYQAVSFYHADVPASIEKILSLLSASLNESEMQELNASVLYKNRTFEEVARDFLLQKQLIKQSSHHPSSLRRQMLSRTGEHIALTLISILAAVLISIPAGILIYWSPSITKPVLYITGLLQTIPSIALLAIMIPLFGIGMVPAVVALFLYALLPIIRNTVAGLKAIDPTLVQVAESLGMSRYQKLRLVEFPLSLPIILSGIRVATVINIGTATLAAFIGAGGLGEFIVTGLALNNTTLILYGAIPAAILAIVTEIGFELIEKKINVRSA